MKNYIKYLGILALGMVACEPEFENPIEGAGTYTSGEADFSHYVALGNSLTAGYADNALYITGQEASYPNILAQKFAQAGGGGFTQPLMADNAGGLLLGGNQIAGRRLVLAVDAEGNPSPATYTGQETTTEVTETLDGPFNNMGVPGAKSYHLVAPGYGNPAGVAEGAANPYFARFASSAQATVLEDAIAQEPTFFSLWIGNNDVLGYATSGGVGTDQTENPDVTSYGSNDITAPQVFAQVYSNMVQALVANGAEGVLVNIPNVTDVPYFTTVPNNALQLDATTAGQLTGFFRAVAAIFAQGLMQQGVPEEQAQALAAQYALEFNEGPNRFVIDVPQTEANPLGFRQMTEDELLVLTIDQAALRQGYGSVALTPEVMEVLGMLQQGEQPTREQAQMVLDAVNGIDDGDALDSSEIENINEATAAYNNTIQAVADQHDLALLDAASLLSQLSESGISYNGGTLTSEFAAGGAFSLDGVHLTPRGYALVADRMIDEINETYNANVPGVNIGNYQTVTPSNEVN